MIGKWLLDARSFASLIFVRFGYRKVVAKSSSTLVRSQARGVRKITLVDSGKVAMSNPLRQSLYALQDCLNGGDDKALAAVKSLTRIFSAVEAEGIVMNIPTPGHPVGSKGEEKVLNDCRRLSDLIESHDAVFLLTDTRESRWFPSLLCANSNKVTINAALGFDSFLVMRPGVGPLEPKAETVGSLSDGVGQMSLGQKGSKTRLGCYFCNDVVAPVDVSIFLRSSSFYPRIKTGKIVILYLNSNIFKSI